MSFRLSFPLLAALLFLAGCKDKPHAPAKPVKPIATFEGLPLTGNQGTALAAGFAECLDAPHGLRCTRHAVYVVGAGPYTAAIDLPTTGAPTFDHVTLWHDRDQGAILDIGDTLKKDGWQSCLSGDFESYGRMGSPIRVVIDASYWGKRRAVITLADKPFRSC